MPPDPTIPILTSARHVHLTQETVNRLFGEGTKLESARDINQPGQFAAEQTLALVSPEGRIDEVRVLGPTRDYNQVEISKTDGIKLGLNPPVRRSGEHEDSPGIVLEGPKGRVELPRGVICASRHIHMMPKNAEEFGVRDGQVVAVEVSGGDRDLIFKDVLVRVADIYTLEMHIDTDEANAASVGRKCEGRLIGES